MNLKSVPTRGRTLDYAAGIYDIFEPMCMLGKETEINKLIISLLEIRDSHECLDCHHPDKDPQGPPTPHPGFSGCIKCHND